MAPAQALEAAQRTIRAKMVSNQIRYAQRRGFSAAKIKLSKSDEDVIAALTNFCRALHQYSFVAKYFYNRDDRIAWLTLQTRAKFCSAAIPGKSMSYAISPTFVDLGRRGWKNCS